MIFETRDAQDTADDRLVDRLTETAADRAARLSQTRVPVDRAVILRRALGMGVEE